MNRSTAVRIFAATMLATLAGTAQAQLGYTQPVVGNVESIGNSTRLMLAIPAGQAAGGFLINAEQIVVELYIFNAAGTGPVLAGPFNPPGFGGALPNYSNAAGNTVNVDLSTVNFGGNLIAGNLVIANARTAGSTGLTNVGPTPVAITGLAAVIDLGNEGNDTAAAVDTAAPFLQNAFITGGQLYCVFNERLNNGAAGNDNNHTVLANITGADFQVDTVNSFDGTEVSPTNLSNPAIIGATNTVIRFDVGGGSTASIGSFIRPFFNNSGTPTHDVFDNVHNRATNAAVQMSAPAALAVTSVQWINTVTGNGANQADRIRVTFNNPINTVGSAAFYNRLFVDRDSNTAGLETSFITVDLVTADPANPNAVVLRVDSSANEGVSADGLRTASNGVLATGQYTLMLDAAIGTPPQDLFNQNFAGTANPTISDAIRPSFVFAAYGDSNPADGSQDTAYLVFDEPVANLTSNTGFTVVRQGGVTVRPFALLNMTTGALPTGIMTVANATPANNNLPGLVVTRSSIDGVFSVNGDGVLDARETNNAICLAYNPLTFDWDNDGTAGTPADTNEAVPGTGDPNVVNIMYTIATASIVDANGNVFNNSGTDVNEAVNVDRASPRVSFVRAFTGDNQIEVVNSDNSQLFSEQDGNSSDQLNNNRVAIFFGENLANADNADNENQIRFGPGGVNGFNNDTNFANNSGSHVGQNPLNSLTLRNDGNNAAVIPGVAISFLPGSGKSDVDDNEVLSGDVVSTNRIAPYCPLIIDVNGSAIDAAFLFDADSDGFADSIRISMTQPIDSATVQQADFTLSLGTQSGAPVVQGNDIVLSVNDGVIPMTSLVTVTYQGAADGTPIASLTTGGGTGVAMSATNDSVVARRIPTPDRNTQELAFMDIVGTITTNGTTPVPPGTKVYAMNAVPAVYAITATHNNVAFTVDWTHDDSDSIAAWNAWLYGIQDFIYLGRDEQNFQQYLNKKYDFSTDGDDAINTYKDIIALNINAANLTNITFTGTGETTADKITNGRVLLAWDVIRGNGDDIEDFFDEFTSTDVTPFDGTPLISSTVVLGTDGRFELHHSAPAALFNGASRLSAVGRPVIIVVELPDGKRFGASSILTSVNGPPLLFQIQNRSQSLGQAPNASVFNINLANIGTQNIFEGWNTVPFPRAGGFATAAGSRPVLPNGVVVGNVVIPGTANPALPFTGVLEQFLWWGENTVDKCWTRAEDSDFSNVFVDPDFFPYFAFTMTSAGVQMGSAMNNLVGGYALAFFNNTDNFGNYGIFQFGAPLSGNTLFDGLTAATTFPNNATTQGWGLFTSKAAFNPATGIRGTANPDLDFIFVFRNNGPNAAANNLPRMEVTSLDLVAPTGTDNPNDTVSVGAGEAFFGHWQP